MRSVIGEIGFLSFGCAFRACQVACGPACLISHGNAPDKVCLYLLFLFSVPCWAYGELSVRRLESQGLLNLVRVEVLVDGVVAGEVEAAEEVVFNPPAGRHVITARSINPYESGCALSSNRLQSPCKQGEALTVVIEDIRDDVAIKWRMMREDRACSARPRRIHVK